jgi:hypothetical protein
LYSQQKKDKKKPRKTGFFRAFETLCVPMK